MLIQEKPDGRFRLAMRGSKIVKAETGRAARQLLSATLSMHLGRKAHYFVWNAKAVRSDGDAM
jgi:hypothetical protein